MCLPRKSSIILEVDLKLPCIIALLPQIGKQISIVIPAPAGIQLDIEEAS
jgi:hypothetical protein